MRFPSAALLILLLLPASALAHGTSPAPPGNSAVSQYLEVVPTGDGNRPSSIIGRSGSEAGGASAAARSLTPAVQRALARRGAAGRGIIALTDATGVPPPSSTGRHGRRPQGVAGAERPSGPGSSGRGPRGGAPLTTLANALTGASTPGGLSRWLPAILIVTAVGGGLLALLRRRRNT